MTFCFILLGFSFLSLPLSRAEESKEESVPSFIPLGNTNQPEDIRLKYDGFYFLIEKEQFLKTSRQFNFKEDYQAEAENLFLLPLNELEKEKSLWFIFGSIENRLYYKKEIGYLLDTRALKEKLQEISKTVKQEPQEGKFEKNEKNEIYPIQEPQAGYQMDTEKTFRHIIEEITEGKILFQLK